MNLGVVLPEPGYLEAVREITRRHGVVLIFDEVKTGSGRPRRRDREVRRAAGHGHDGQGARRRSAVRRHRRQRRGHGGRQQRQGLPGRHLQREPADDGRGPRQPGGADADAYEHLDMLNDRLMAGCDAVLEKYNLPGYTVGISSKGCVTFSPEKITDYASFKANHDGELCRSRVALHDEPRRLHDARTRRRVDALRRPLVRGRRHVRRRLRGDGARPRRLSGAEPSPGRSTTARRLSGTTGRCR